MLRPGRGVAGTELTARTQRGMIARFRGYRDAQMFSKRARPLALWFLWPVERRREGPQCLFFCFVFFLLKFQGRSLVGGRVVYSRSHGPMEGALSVLKASRFLKGLNGHRRYPQRHEASVFTGRFGHTAVSLVHV